MARQWFIPGDSISEGMMIDEDGTEEFHLPSMFTLINEDQAAAAAGNPLASSLMLLGVGF